MANSRGIISKLSKVVFASYNPPSTLLVDFFQYLYLVELVKTKRIIDFVETKKEKKKKKKDFSYSHNNRKIKISDLIATS